MSNYGSFKGDEKQIALKKCLEEYCDVFNKLSQHELCLKYRVSVNAMNYYKSKNIKNDTNINIKTIERDELGYEKQSFFNRQHPAPLKEKKEKKEEKMSKKDKETWDVIDEHLEISGLKTIKEKPIKTNDIVDLTNRFEFFNKLK